MPVVKQLLEEHGYVTRKAQKSKAMGSHPDRNRQFENIARLKQEYLGSDNPIVSMDTKKKELIGDFYRAGHLLTQGVIETFDHDFPSFASGVVIPHGLYDVKQNDGHVNLGTSHDTGEFACDSIERWWEEKGRALYPGRPRSCCCATGAAATAPASTCSRRTCNGWWIGSGSRSVWLTTRRTARSTTRSSTAVPARDPGVPGRDLRERGVGEGVDGEGEDEHGAGVTVDILDKVYQTGRKYAEGFKEDMKIVFDETLPKWNYRAVPAKS